MSWRRRRNSRMLISAVRRGAEWRRRGEGVVSLGLAFDVDGMLHSY